MAVQGAGQNVPLPGKASETPATVWEEVGPADLQAVPSFFREGH